MKKYILKLANRKTLVVDRSQVSNLGTSIKVELCINSQGKPMVRTFAPWYVEIIKADKHGKAIRSKD